VWAGLPALTRWQVWLCPRTHSLVNLSWNAALFPTHVIMITSGERVSGELIDDMSVAGVIQILCINV